ncbi:vacuole effluxer Atg22 like-domain-containing protein [Mycena sp. CBHHK59/15]|nr:vacuole effluxer Atg22 like-domain-containing protein [Mycena sp. CBHHK59/15]
MYLSTCTARIAMGMLLRSRTTGRTMVSRMAQEINASLRDTGRDNIRRVPRVPAAQTDVLVSDLLFPHVKGDVLNTTVTVIGTLQNSVVAYSTLQLTLLLIVGIVAQGLGIYAFWLVQKRFKISTKAMLSFNVFWIIILTVWGLIGVHTDKFGFKHVWEIWVYQAFYGLMVCPWYAYSQTMISEVSPLPQMFLFFALFSVIGKTSAFIGPFVSSAIITAADNNDNMPFAFLFGLGVVSTVFLWLVDVDKSRIECEAFVRAEQERKAFEPSTHFASAYTGDLDIKMDI